MKITLTIWERAQLGIIVGSGRAPTIEAVDLGLRARSVLRLSDEEKAEVGWIIVGPNQFGWSRDCEYELEFADDVWQMVQMLTRAFQSWLIDEQSKVLYKKVVGDTSDK